MLINHAFNSAQLHLVEEPGSGACGNAVSQQGDPCLIEQTASRWPSRAMDMQEPVHARKLVRSLMESSRPEAELRLKANLERLRPGEAEQMRFEAGVS